MRILIEVIKLALFFFITIIFLSKNNFSTLIYIKPHSLIQSNFFDSFTRKSSCKMDVFLFFAVKLFSFINKSILIERWVIVSLVTQLLIIYNTKQIYLLMNF